MDILAVNVVVLRQIELLLGLDTWMTPQGRYGDILCLSCSLSCCFFIFFRVESYQRPPLDGFFFPSAKPRSGYVD